MGDLRRIARRFPGFEDLILRFATRPDLDIFSSNEAERTIRPVKVQQRGSGGCWRTLTGLAEFTLIQSYLSTAAKWDISRLAVDTRVASPTIQSLFVRTSGDAGRLAVVPAR